MNRVQSPNDWTWFDVRFHETIEVRKIRGLRSLSARLTVPITAIPSERK